ncbi:MAG TPA: hypothetical protein DCG57_00865, partial [Candidatus Riflebacteria bacterium]|nr:hypothetical protein [Candidatus Riflebacteria bacterium]
DSRFRGNDGSKGASSRAKPGIQYFSAIALSADAGNLTKQTVSDMISVTKTAGSVIFLLQPIYAFSL